MLCAVQKKTNGKNSAHRAQLATHQQTQWFYEKLTFLTMLCISSSLRARSWIMHQLQLHRAMVQALMRPELVTLCVCDVCRRAEAASLGAICALPWLARN